MNVFECRNGKQGDFECLFRITRSIDGEPQTFGCVLHAGNKGHDYYNLYPELSGSESYVEDNKFLPMARKIDLAEDTRVQLSTNKPLLNYETDGDVVYQPSNRGDPWKLGSDFNEENLTENQSGKTFDFRSFDADIHPKYHRIDYNIPTKSRLEDTDIGEIMGDEHPALVHSIWEVEKFEGISSVDTCKHAIFGKFNIKDNIVLHTCMKSHVGLPGWVDYTNSGEVPRKIDLYIGFAPDEEIIDYAKSFFKGKVADKIAEAMIAVKNGAYCNFWVLLKNNFIDVKTIKKFVSKINIESFNSIYHKNAWGSRQSIEQYVKLYGMIEKMEWKESTINEEGKTKEELFKVPEDYIQRYKENILNWILNHPMLQSVKLPSEDDIGNRKYKPEQRYWFMIPMFRRAFKDGTLNKNGVMIPPWIVKIIKHKSNPMVKVFNESKKYSELTKDQKGEFHDAQILQLDTLKTDSADNINRQYPGMRVIKPELPQDELKNIDLVGGWPQFVLLLHLGRRWTILEIKNAWEYFYHSFMQDDPSIFYDWIEKIADSPIEPIYTLSREEFNDIVLKDRIHNSVIDSSPETTVIVDYPEEQIDTLLEGAIEYNIGDGDLALGNGQGVRFAKNILEASVNYKKWNSWDDYYVTKIPLGNWFETSGKVKNHRECQHETFYAMLATSRALKEDDKFAKSYLSEEGYKEVAEVSQENIATLSSSIECGYDEILVWNNPQTADEEEEELWLGAE